MPPASYVWDCMHQAMEPGKWVNVSVLDSFQFGEKGKMCLVRFLNSTVMVRVGGGWVTLSKYLESNDPCRAKGRINTELRESFILPDGAAQSRINFQTRRRSSLPSSQGEYRLLELFQSCAMHGSSSFRREGNGQWPSGRVDLSEPGGPGFDSSSRQPQVVAHQHWARWITA